MTIYCGVCAWLSLFLVSGIFVLVFGVLFLIDIFFQLLFCNAKKKKSECQNDGSFWWSNIYLQKSDFDTARSRLLSRLPCMQRKWSSLFKRLQSTTFWSLAGSEVRRESCLLSQMATFLNWVIIENARDIFWRYWNERENIVFNLLT